MTTQFPSALSAFVHVVEMDTAVPFALDVFARKYRSRPPDFGRHFMAFVSTVGSDGWRVASYLHLWERNGVGYLGGAATDGNVVRSLPPDQRAAIDACRGLYIPIARWVFGKYGKSLEAVFGYCGDAQQMQRNLFIGFQRLPGQEFLIGYFPKELGREQQAELIRDAIAVGPF